MRLASVIQRNIRTVYPDQSSRLLPVFQTTFQPRHRLLEFRSFPDVVIMWTNTGGWSNRSKSFWVNHFVPLIRRACLLSPSMTTSSADSIHDWNAAKQKKRGKKVNYSSNNNSNYFGLFRSSKTKATNQPKDENRWKFLIDDEVTDLLEGNDGVSENSDGNFERTPVKKAKLKDDHEEKMKKSNKEVAGNCQNNKSNLETMSMEANFEITHSEQQDVTY